MCIVLNSKPVGEAKTDVSLMASSFPGYVLVAIRATPSERLISLTCHHIINASRLM